MGPPSVSAFAGAAATIASDAFMNPFDGELNDAFDWSFPFSCLIFPAQ